MTAMDDVTRWLRARLVPDDPANRSPNVAADLRLLWELEDAESRERYYARDGEEPFVSEARGYADALRKAVRIRAAAYADRPGWREEWRS